MGKVPDDYGNKSRCILLKEDEGCKYDRGWDQFRVMLSTRTSDPNQGDSLFCDVKQDDYWNSQQYECDLEMQAWKKYAETDQMRWVVKHPNIHNFNATQAKYFLEKQQHGNVVIQPSSKGVDHLAVTWKVEDRLYQHIGVS